MACSHAAVLYSRSRYEYALNCTGFWLAWLVVLPGWRRERFRPGDPWRHARRRPGRSAPARGRGDHRRHRRGCRPRPRPSRTSYPAGKFPQLAPGYQMTPGQMLHVLRDLETAVAVTWPRWTTSPATPAAATASVISPRS